MRYLFYTPSDGIGLGHVQRNLTIARAVATVDPDASVLLVHGTVAGDAFTLPPGVDTLRLPGVRRTGTGYLTQLGLPADDVLAQRSALLSGAVRSFHPDVLVVDKYPLGAAGEAAGAIATVREHGGTTVFGMRDVLDHGARVRRDWAARGTHDVLDRQYDRVLVYGQPEVFDAVREYGLPPRVARRTTYCGYTAPAPAPDVLVSRSGEAPVVLATAGGGEDGFRLLEVFLRAADGGSWNAIAVAGPQTAGREASVLDSLARDAGAEFHTFVPDLAALFPTVGALVCMGGYNTLTDAVATATPTVCVPRVEPGGEQAIRARAFERLGLVRVIEPSGLDAASLRDAVAAALAVSRHGLATRARASLAMDGDRRAAEVIVDAAREAAPRHELRLRSTNPTSASTLAKFSSTMSSSSKVMS